MTASSWYVPSLRDFLACISEIKAISLITYNLSKRLTTNPSRTYHQAQTVDEPVSVYVGLYSQQPGKKDCAADANMNVICWSQWICFLILKQTGSCLHTRKKEHIRNTKVFKNGSNIASHAWLEGHTIDFENARVIDRGNSHVRKTLESWHTAITSHADNNSKQLPRQYSILL